jgi:hypothetical protein
MAVEEHGSGKQLFRFRAQPRHSRLASAIVLVLVIGAASAAYSEADLVCAFLAVSAAWLAFHVIQQCGGAVAVVDRAIQECQDTQRGMAVQPQVPRPARGQLEPVP